LPSVMKQLSHTRFSGSDFKNIKGAKMCGVGGEGPTIVEENI